MLSRKVRKAGADATRLSLFQSRSERAIKRTFEHIRNNLDVEGARRQLALSNYEGAIDAFVAPFASISDTLVQIFTNAGHDMATEIGQKIGQVVSFNATDHYTVSEMRNLRTAFIADINSTVRESLRAIMLHGLQNNWSQEDMLKAMVGSIGLTTRDLDAIQNYRRGIERGNTRLVLTTELRDRRYDAAVLNGTAADLHLDRMVAAKARLTRQVTLSRLATTETLRAVNMGRNALMQQLINTGTVQAENVQRTWVATGDSRTRDSHANQSGETRGFNEPFSNGLMFPGDPNGPASEVVNCRCWLIFDAQPN